MICQKTNDISLLISFHVCFDPVLTDYAYIGYWILISQATVKYKQYNLLLLRLDTG